MKILSIVESAYRGTLEEQDDTVLWLNHSVRNAGAELGLLLRGNAVNYLARGQDASGLTFGDKPLAHPLQPDKEFEALLAAGVAVYAVEEDLRERALAAELCELDASLGFSAGYMIATRFRLMQRSDAIKDLAESAVGALAGSLREI